MTVALVRNIDVRNFIVRLMMRAGTNQVCVFRLLKLTFSPISSLKDRGDRLGQGVGRCGLQVRSIKFL